MHTYWHSIFRQRFDPFILLIVTIAILSIIYYGNNISTPRISYHFEPVARSIVPQDHPTLKHLNIIDMQGEPTGNFDCVKTKYLLRLVRTTICVHENVDAISRTIRTKKIWEEPLLTELYGLFLRYPEMSFIDAGANVGTYTMFAASLGRFVLSIECFKPNIDRIRKAVQIEKLQDKVVLVGNAIYLESGKYLRMKSDPTNVGSQAIVPEDSLNGTNNDPYVVKTMRFDDILPILKQRNIRHAFMKVDIQWAESFLCQTGNETFDYVNMPVIQMEWDAVPHYRDRTNTVLNYFLGRGYTPTSDMCNVLDINNALTHQSWPGDMYWVKLNRSEIC